MFAQSNKTGMVDAHVSGPSMEPIEPATRLRLEYLDGMRGLAALYVVMYHCYMQVSGSLDVTVLALLPLLATRLLSFGHMAVDIFIVLSGYCLMLPVARSLDRCLPQTTREFFMRRARRILPPYYAALAVSLVLIAAVPALGHKSGANWDMTLPAFTSGALLSHLLLVHDLFPQWRLGIDYPMWSVATEWQIYFLFPFLLLPVWRRFGNCAAIMMGFAFWLSIHILFRARFDGAALHFTSLFTFGMTAADLGFSQDVQKTLWRERLPWGSFAVALFVCLAGLMAINPLLLEKHTSQVDLLAGACSACLIIYCTRHLSEERRSRSIPLQIFQSRPALALGSFSYSLYLIHAPVVAICFALLRDSALSPLNLLMLILLISLPAALLISYFFYLGCERPFLQRRSTKEDIKNAVDPPIMTIAR